MGRRREDGRLYENDGRGPIPLDPVNVLAGIAPGLELTADDLPAGIAGNEEASEAMLTVEELRPHVAGGREHHPPPHSDRRHPACARRRRSAYPRSQVEAYQAGLHRSSPEKPGE